MIDERDNSTLKCIICDNEKFSTAGEFNRDLLRCNQCNLIFYRDIKDIVPSDVYNTDYFNNRYYSYSLDKHVLQRNFSKRLETIGKFLDHGKLLEIGSAYGFFLELAKKDFSVYGIDIAQDAVRYSNEELKIPNVTCGDYLSTRYEESFFDVICLFDTIEHLKEPQKYLEKAYRELKTGGMIILTTGDIASFTAKTQKEKWRLINIPTHLFYFSFSNLKILLKRHNFEIIHKSYPGYYRSLASMLYLTVFKDRKSITSSKMFQSLRKLHIYLNLYDIMLVVARKQ